MELAICLADAVAIAFSLFLAGMVRYGSFAALNECEDIRMMYGGVFLLHIALFYFMKVTDGFFRRGRYRELLLCIRYNVLLTTLIIFFGFAIKDMLIISRLMAGYFFVINPFLLWIVHLMVRNRGLLFRMDGRRKENLLIVTDSGQIGRAHV